MTLARLDVVCRVIDHFGDAGFCWRLARQLAAEHGLAVRLWIDDLAPLSRIAPIDGSRDAQRAAGVDVDRLDDAVVPNRLPDAVVAAFGCALPPSWIDAFAASSAPPLWIHLDYLTAEAWADGAHGLPSPPPRHPALRRWYFVPGFTPATGGLLRERGLAGARSGFVADADAQRATWRTLGLDAPAPGELAVSLFCYANAALPALLDTWSAGDAPLRVVVPEGVASADLARACGAALPAPGGALRRGALTLAVAPLVDQDAFDRRLWACDLDVVRGEDSFVRAQWAARPLVWQPYRQQDRLHDAKLEAFLARYLAAAPEPAAAALAAFARAFNAEDPASVAGAWPGLRAALPDLDRHARDWAAALARQSDLATRLVQFIGSRL